MVAPLWKRSEEEGKGKGEIPRGESTWSSPGKIARKWTVSLASARQPSSIFPPAHRVFSPGPGSLDRGGLIAAKRGGEEGSR